MKFPFLKITACLLLLTPFATSQNSSPKPSPSSVEPGLSAINGVVSKTDLIIPKGTSDGEFDDGDLVTLKRWDDGSFTLDGSGATNRKVKVVVLFGVTLICPRTGDCFVAIPAPKQG